ITFYDYTKISSPFINLDQMEHIYDNRYNWRRNSAKTFTEEYVIDFISVMLLLTFWIQIGVIRKVTIENKTLLT
ncbi:MAG: hypothetical protein PVG70_16960, partial [Desulfobacterales bacterium]